MKVFDRRLRLAFENETEANGPRAVMSISVQMDPCGGNDHATAHEEDMIPPGVLCAVFTVGGGDARKVWKDVTDRELCGKSALNPPSVV